MVNSREDAKGAKGNTLSAWRKAHSAVRTEFRVLSTELEAQGANRLQIPGRQSLDPGQRSVVGSQ